jgi:hypothetical protein
MRGRLLGRHSSGATASILDFVSLVPFQAPWDMTFVQYASAVTSPDTAWITGAERWILNGTEQRTLPVHAVQGRSYLIKYYPGTGYRFRTIQVYPLQCTTADCNRPAVQQASSALSSAPTTTLSAAAALAASSTQQFNFQEAQDCKQTVLSFRAVCAHCFFCRGSVRAEDSGGSGQQNSFYSGVLQCSHVRKRNGDLAPAKHCPVALSRANVQRSKPAARRGRLLGRNSRGALGHVLCPVCRHRQRQ